MSEKTTATDPHIVAITRALRRASDRALRLAKATRTPFWVVKNGQLVNLNPNAKGVRKRHLGATTRSQEPRELKTRAKKARSRSR
jgi:hypothetical protein